MPIKIRTWLFLLFGLQGVMQVVYWETIKGYPACFMCKGYRVLYLAIVMSALWYVYRPRLNRVYVLCGAVMAETFWSLWDFFQKVGTLSQKCHAAARIVDGKMVFTSCTSQHSSWLKVICSPVGVNTLLSILMCGYALRVLWKTRCGHQRFLQWIGCVGLLGMSVTPTEAAVDDRLLRALKAQEQRAKAYDAEMKSLEQAATIQSKSYQKETEAIVKKQPTQEMMDAAQTVIVNKNTCTGKCPTFNPTPDQEHKVKICMSFSVPAHVWKELNQELIKHEGVFVVKGLPNNSFQAFTEKVLELRKQGITAPIQIDPKLFEQLNITLVPQFIWKHEGEIYTASGTVTLSHVMGLVRESKGMTP